MKKVALGTVVYLLSGMLIAQSVHLGVKFGGLGTKIDGKSFESGYKLSYQGGAFAELDLGKLGLQPELLFSQTSSKYAEGTSTLVNGVITDLSKTDLKLSYLSIPILLRYKLMPFVTLQLGPQYSILLNKNANLVDNGKAAFKGGDFSLLGGIQVHIGSLRAYGRYCLGLSDISDVSSEEKWKNQQIQVGVGFAIF